jgi:hypothetical protein
MAVQPKLPSGGSQKYTGQMTGKAGHEKFAEPLEAHANGLIEMGGTHNDIGELSGFESGNSGYIVKKGTPYGEAAKFNFLPPGMDINDQENRDIRDMPLKKITAESYPGDGWEPAPRDMPE